MPVSDETLIFAYVLALSAGGLYDSRHFRHFVDVCRLKGTQKGVCLGGSAAGHHHQFHIPLGPRVEQKIASDLPTGLQERVYEEIAKLPELSIVFWMTTYVDRKDVLSASGQMVEEGSNDLDGVIESIYRIVPSQDGGGILQLLGPRLGAPCGGFRSLISVVWGGRGVVGNREEGLGHSEMQSSIGETNMMMGSAAMARS